MRSFVVLVDRNGFITDSAFDAVTYKYVLLPTWSLAYRYNEKTYHVVVNGATGEVQGERPWSVAKIAAAVISAVVLIEEADASAI